MTRKGICASRGQVAVPMSCFNINTLLRLHSFRLQGRTALSLISETEIIIQIRHHELQMNLYRRIPNWCQIWLIWGISVLECMEHLHTYHARLLVSYHLPKIAGCVCGGNAGKVSPATGFRGNGLLAIPACITACAQFYAFGKRPMVHLMLCYLGNPLQARYSGVTHTCSCMSCAIILFHCVS